LFLLVIVLLAVVVLAACGGEDAAPEAAAPTAAAAAPTTVAGDTPADPTAVPPTAEATIAPSPVPPTAEPDAPAVATGECGHEFYPVVDGRALTYTTNAEGLGAGDYTTTFSNVTDSSFTLTTDVGDGDIFATDWQCAADGLLSPEFSQMPGSMDDLQIEFVEATGFTIPTADRFRVGESWPTHYVANATMAVADSDPIVMVQTIDMTNTVTGIEAVSVPAGDYPEAVVVDTVTTISIGMTIDGVEQSMNAIEMSYQSWYVEGIGLVRQEIADFFDEAGGSYVTELVAIE
jgi:hypothetical protein